VRQKKSLEIAHRFIELLPDTLEERTLYVSVEYKSIVHLCFCGCGKKVVTPLSPTGWSMTFNGKTISMQPSIGNWNLACRSHYWIRDSRVRWADQWSQAQIDEGFARDVRLKDHYYARVDAAGVVEEASERSDGVGHFTDKGSWWTALKKRLSGRGKER
jgi:Family of unknown function (DUF6527)